MIKIFQKFENDTIKIGLKLIKFRVKFLHHKESSIISLNTQQMLKILDKV